MYDFINNYLLFLIELFSIFTLISILLIILFTLKIKKNNNIKIEHINKKYMYIKKKILNKIMKKKLYKKIIKDEEKKIKITEKKNNIYVMKFNGDIYAKDINKFKDIISVLISITKKNDQVLMILNSNGGFVNNYGLAALQLNRIKSNNIKLIISIDLIAASGGYLMACVGNYIIASKFAIIGSIGVIGQVPNFNKLLDKNNIEIEEHTSGEFKTTLTLFGKNTEKGRKRFCEYLEKTHIIFKKFILSHRKKINIEKISSGEYWYGDDAIDLNLIDKIQTSDEYITDHLDTHNIYEITIEENQKNKLSNIFKNI